ncbi:hypothetical protein [Nostoc sp. TCL26-01]|uniref:hypothetical protein n=1 Tax=Nostoc sp. TCL26-01 TaxID=2576904 RepID=UPI0015B85CD0|nr:hypothetical protein [Nostoc sp. TCL26-01]QLE54719.1 hypothetical protein FD725_03870 [Nostoc sp. TCL26-01]
MKRLIYTAALCMAIFSPTIASAGEVYHRPVQQQRRIYQGVHQGTITPAEFRRLERQRIKLNAARRRDLRDGRGLSVRERRNLNRRENRLSRQIYRDRHD